MKAVILAAGEGRRLKPLTNLRPKPMIPIANRPLLEHVVTAVVEAGVTEIVLVVGYKRERIQSYFGDGEEWNVDISYAIQDKQLGTGHAILQAEEFVDDDFLALNGDRIIESAVVRALIERHEANGETLLAVTPTDRPTDYGVVELRGDRVTNIVEKPRWGRPRSELINAGVYCFEQSIFDEIRATDSGPGGESSIVTTIGRLIEDGGVRGIRSRGMWIDVSNLWDVLGVNSSALDQAESSVGTGFHRSSGAEIGDGVQIGDDCRVGHNATIGRGTAIGDNVTVGANAVVSNAVVLSDSIIDDGAVVRDCIVAGNSYVGPNVTVEGGTADLVVEEEYYEDVTLGGVVGDNARVGGGVYVEPGSIIGNSARVAGGATVTGRVPPHAEVRRG